MLTAEETYEQVFRLVQPRNLHRCTDGVRSGMYNTVNIDSDTAHKVFYRLNVKADLRLHFVQETIRRKARDDKRNAEPGDGAS